MAKKKAASAKPEDTAACIFDESLAYILDEIRGIVNGDVEPEEHDAASRVARLAKQAASVAAEKRKAENADLTAIKKLSPSVVMTWVKAQSAEFRSRLVRDIVALDAKERRSVLG